MPQKRKLVIITLTILWLSAISIPSLSAEETKEELKWHKDMASAMKAATKDKKNMIVDVFTSWCGWCKVMDRQTFSDAKVIKFMKDYIPVKINAEVDKAFARKYRVSSYPTVLLLDSKGSEIGRIRGFQKPDPFIQSVKQSVSSAKPRIEMEKKYALGTLKTSEKLELAKNYLEDNVEVERALKLLDQVINSTDAGENEKGNAHYFYGIHYLRQRAPDKAQEHLEKIITDYSSFEGQAQSLIYLGQAYHLQKKYPQALEIYTKFLKQYPTRRETKWIEKQIERIKKELE